MCVIICDNGLHLIQRSGYAQLALYISMATFLYILTLDFIFSKYTIHSRARESLACECELVGGRHCRIFIMIVLKSQKGDFARHIVPYTVHLFAFWVYIQ